MRNTCIKATTVIAWLCLQAGTNAQDILKFSDGVITFTNSNPSLYYQVEYAPCLRTNTPWISSYTNLTNIRSTAPTISVPVGVFYRITGSATPTYLTGGDATPSDILSGKIAYVNDSEVAGTMVNRGEFTFQPTSSGISSGQGYYSSVRVQGDPNLRPENIVAGASIFGVAGAAPAPTRIIRLGGDLAFSSVDVGQTRTSTLVVYNDGDSTLTVNAITYPAGFSGNWTGGIVSGGSRSIVVTFAPTAVQSYSGAVSIGSDRTSGTHTIPCSGSGSPVVPTGGDPTAISWEVFPPQWVKNTYANGHVTMSDRNKNIMWLYDASASGKRNWEGAFSYCQTLVYAGHSDWYLPDSATLLSHYSQIAYFANVPYTDYYWSSTPASTYGAVGLKMSTGNLGDIYKTSLQWIWPCRSTQ